MLKSFRTNAMGPLLVVKAFGPLLMKATQLNAADGGPPAVVANLSARVSSIADNGLGGWYAYRASKTAGPHTRSTSFDMDENVLINQKASIRYQARHQVQVKLTWEAVIVVTALRDGSERADEEHVYRVRQEEAPGGVPPAAPRQVSS
jgi:hypothetical protein